MFRDLLVVQIPLLEKALRSVAVYLFLVVAAVRRQGARNLEGIDLVVLEANGALTVEQHDRIEEVLRRLQRIEVALSEGRGSGSRP